MFIRFGHGGFNIRGVHLRKKNEFTAVFAELEQILCEVDPIGGDWHL